MTNNNNINFLSTDNTFMAISIYNNNNWSNPENNLNNLEHNILPENNLEYSILPYSKILIEPSATVLNYGQGIFEGMKAYLTNNNNIVLFRPDMNYNRLLDGCNRLLIPTISKTLFLNMCTDMIKKNINNIPDNGEGEFYIRPILFGSGSGLGLYPSNQYTIIIYGTPIKQYFSNNVNLLIENKYVRSYINGIGNIKTIANYAQTFLPLEYARNQGYSDILFMDIDTKFIEESSSSNFFCIDNDNNLLTPKLGSILPGITRDCIIEICTELKQKKIINDIIIDNITIDNILNSKEAFLSGTMVGIKLINSITFDNNNIKKFVNYPITNIIKKKYYDIKFEITDDIYKWLYYINK